jgi:hypothetical protein
MESPRFPLQPPILMNSSGASHNALLMSFNETNWIISLAPDDTFLFPGSSKQNCNSSSDSVTNRCQAPSISILHNQLAITSEVFVPSGMYCGLLWVTDTSSYSAVSIDFDLLVTDALQIPTRCDGNTNAAMLLNDKYVNRQTVDTINVPDGNAVFLNFTLLLPNTSAVVPTLYITGTPEWVNVNRSCVHGTCTVVFEYLRMPHARHSDTFCISYSAWLECSEKKSCIIDMPVWCEISCYLLGYTKEARAETPVHCSIPLTNSHPTYMPVASIPGNSTAFSFSFLEVQRQAVYDTSFCILQQFCEPALHVNASFVINSEGNLVAPSYQTVEVSNSLWQQSKFVHNWCIRAEINLTDSFFLTIGSRPLSQYALLDLSLDKTDLSRSWTGATVLIVLFDVNYFIIATCCNCGIQRPCERQVLQGALSSGRPQYLQMSCNVSCIMSLKRLPC